MPTYEYQCANCGVFEVTQRITEPSLKKCPTCKGKVERLISHSSFILKGSGWYATDYARSGTRSDGANSGTSSSESSANGSTSSPASSSSEKPGESSKSDKPAASSTDKGTAGTAKSAD